MSDSMVGSYISKFNTWGAQTDDSKLESNIKVDTEDDGMDDGIEEKCQQNGGMPGESLGLYQRSVVKMKTLGSEMMSSYKEPLDNAVISGTELQYFSITISISIFPPSLTACLPVCLYLTVMLQLCSSPAGTNILSDGAVALANNLVKVYWVDEDQF